MKTLSNQTTTMRFSFPWTWDPSALSALTLTMATLDRTDLFDTPVSASLYTATTLDSAASRYATQIVLADDSDALEIGDLIRLVGVLGSEDHVVKGWDLSNLTAILESHIDRDFEAGAAVYRLSAVATVDLSDTDTFPPGIQVVVTWTPTGTGAPVTEVVEIEAGVQVDLQAFNEEFRALYPRAYDALRTPADRLGIVLRSAQRKLRVDLLRRGLDIARITDQSLIAPPLMALVAWKWALGGDEDTEDERKVIGREYSAALEDLCLNPIWVDLNGDGTQNSDEVDIHPAIFERQW